MNQTELTPHAAIMKFIVGKWISKPIYVAAELGIADLLTEGPKHIDEIARQSQSHAPTLYRVMRALASVGIFKEIEERQFGLTPMAECLKTGAMRSIAIMFNSDWNDKAWSYLLNSMKTGETPFEKAHGLPISDWLEENPSAAEILHQANTIKAAVTHRVIVDEYDFSEFKTVTDIGGGSGVLMAEILRSNDWLEGSLAELPSVVLIAEKMIQSLELEDRCKIIECDFFKDVPKGSDGYILSNILHDWSDDSCQIILKNCLKAMKSKSKLLIIEMVVPPLNTPSIAKLLDLEMLVVTGGRERTETEFKILIESSGFRISRIIPTKESISIIEVVRL